LWIVFSVFDLKERHFMRGIQDRDTRFVLSASPKPRLKLYDIANMQ
jgi:hypothetical protein